VTDCVDAFVLRPEPALDEPAIDLASASPKREDLPMPGDASLRRRQLAQASRDD
jgi:hypothetical protein